MRLLSESRVTQRGSFLMRGGAVHPIDTLGDGFTLLYTLNFVGSSSWVKPEPGSRWVEVFVMMTKLESSTETGKSCHCGLPNICQLKNFNLLDLCRLDVKIERTCSGCLGCDSKPSPGDSKPTVIPWSDVGCLFPSRSPTGTKAVSVRSASRLDWLSLRPLHCHATGLPRFRGQDLLNLFPCQGPPFRSITPRRDSLSLYTSNQTELAQVDASTSKRGQRTCMG